MSSQDLTSARVRGEAFEMSLPARATGYDRYPSVKPARHLVVPLPLVILSPSQKDIAGQGLPLLYTLAESRQERR